MTPDRDKAARDLLAFYLEAGVDALVGEAPVDRFADEPLPSKSTSPRAQESGPSGSGPRVAAPSGRAEGAPEGKLRAAGRGSTANQSTLRPELPPSPIFSHKVGERLANKGERSSAAVPPAPPSPDAAIMTAREAARSAGTLDELRAMLEKFQGCALRTTATQLVFADGNPSARVMFVGEAPGYEEDKQGLPFVGRSGQLLNRMLAAIGLERSSAYIANIVPWRPPGNRTPTPQESAICLPFVRRQIELANPEILVCLGGPSMQTLLGIKDGILKTRGRWFAFDTGTREIRAIATLHPAYLLRQPLQKRLAWRDFLAIKRALAG